MRPVHPLPNKRYNGIEQEAYHLCRILEALEEWPATVKSTKTPALCGRVLGYMLQEAPTAQGHSNVASQILLCQNDDDPYCQLEALATLYLDEFIYKYVVITIATALPPNYPVIWSNLDLFGLVDLDANIDTDSKSVHSLQNMLTLNVTTQGDFDRMLAWFEADSRMPHHYRFVLNDPRTGKLKKSEVLDMRSLSNLLPPPSKEYLRLHEACAKVTYLSGGDVYADRLSHEAQEAGESVWGDEDLAV
ncbi:hypothetical protein BV25DRAFT_1901290 [Artomyces pyxidatus]|uniref:Uncharacterized protein n=1 Tax=Artomyces pyxidatus TaxID=48021 RepID=A0ACB8SW74_9AGAM|nr:hypothetical protein BV25DRAFT_1901290 [Artomyces pyxidatus]